TSANTIGGTTVAARNVISGNSGRGVDLLGAVTGNVVQGNFIGTKADGTTALPNASHGVFLTGGAASNTVGGTLTGAGNVLAFNGGNGVLVGSDPTIGFVTPPGAGNAV